MISWKSATLFLFRSILITFKVFHVRKGMRFFKIRPSDIASPFPKLSCLAKSEQKLQYPKHLHVCDVLVKLGPLSRINWKTKSKVSIVFGGYAKLMERIKSLWERILCLDDATWKARCAESVQLAFRIYEQQYSNYSNDFPLSRKCKNYLQRKSITPYHYQPFLAVFQGSIYSETPFLAETLGFLTVR